MIKRILIAFCLPLLVAQSALAQDDESGPTLVRIQRVLPEIEIDVAAMLDSDWTLAGAAEDAIWRITPAPGQRLVQIPLTLTPVLEDAELTSHVLRISRGQVLCYRIEEPGTEAEHQTLLGSETPHFTRSLTLTTKDRLVWSLDRVVSARQAVVRSSSLPYAMVIDRELLRNINPGAPPAVVKKREETTAQYITRARAEEAAYKAAKSRYLDLQRIVNELPTDFSIPNQPHIWVVAQLHDQAERLEISAGDTLNWSITFDQLNAMQNMLRNPPVPVGDETSKRLPEHAYQQIVLMNELLDDEHIYSYRMVSHTLHHTGIIVQAQQGDPVYTLMQRVLAGPDNGATLELAKALIAASPRNPQLLKLADAVMDRLDPSSRLLGLKNLLGAGVSAVGTQTSDADSQETLRVTLNTINRLLGDKNADVNAVVAELYATAKKQPEAVHLLGNGVRFDGLDESQLDTVITTVIEDATTQPLAQRWLDVRLISSDDDVLRTRTLELLGERAERVIAAQASREPTGTDQSAMQLDGKTSVRNNPLSIPIDTPSHGLLRLLDTRHDELRDLSWAALPNFRFSQPAGDDGSDELGKMFDRVGALAGRLGSTPMELVMFLRNHAPGDHVNMAMCLLVYQGNTAASAQAARWLMDQRADVGAAMKELNYRERASFAVRLYEGVGRSAPAVVGLLRSRSEDNRLPGWFAEQIAAGDLPADHAWADAYGGPRALLPLVVSSDDDLAVAAASALFLSIRGDASQAATFVARCKALNDQNIDAIEAQWVEVSQEVIRGRIARTSGDYQATLVIHEAASGVDNTIDLGVVQLKADGDTVQFVNQPMTMRMVPGRMTILLAAPAELVNFPTDELDSIPVDEVAESLELNYVEDSGRWRARFAMPHMGEADLILTPIQP